MGRLLLLLALALTGCSSFPNVPGLDPVRAGSPQTIYSPSECIGAVVNGVCHGSVMPEPRYHETCHGAVIGGVCTGAQF